MTKDRLHTAHFELKDTFELWTRQRKRLLKILKSLNQFVMMEAKNARGHINQEKDESEELQVQFVRLHFALSVPVLYHEVALPNEAYTARAASSTGNIAMTAG